MNKYIITLVSIFLMGCGGGSGGGGDSTTTPVPPVEETPVTPPVESAVFIPDEGVYRFNIEGVSNDLVVIDRGDYYTLSASEFSNKEVYFSHIIIDIDKKGVILNASMQYMGDWEYNYLVESPELVDIFTRDNAIVYYPELKAFDVTIGDLVTRIDYVGKVTDFTPVGRYSFLASEPHSYIYETVINNGQVTLYANDGCIYQSTEYYHVNSHVYSTNFISNCGYTLDWFSAQFFSSILDPTDKIMFYMYSGD